MRNDMHKVIAEPARRGGYSIRTRLTNCRNLDELPTHVAIRPKARPERKCSSTNTKPLRRYLASKVGSAWNDVYSDICAGNDLGSTTKREVRDHIGYMVHEDVTIVDNEPYSTGGYRVWRDFWVHPDTGILMAAPPSKKYRWKGYRTEWEQVAIDAETKYVKIDGLWYKVSFKPLIDDEYRAAFKKGDSDVDRVSTLDVIFLGKLERNLQSARTQLTREWGSAIRAVKKRQIGKREIKRLLAKRDEEAQKAANPRLN